MASTTDLAASTEAVSSGTAAFSLMGATELTVFGGVRDGASNVLNFVALATSSMCATEVSSVSVLAAAAWFSRLQEGDDTGLLPSLAMNLLASVSRFGSTSALELKSTLSVYLLSFDGTLSSTEVLSLFKPANCSQTYHTQQQMISILFLELFSAL